MAFWRPQHFHRHFYLASLYRFGSWSCLWFCHVYLLLLFFSGLISVCCVCGGRSHGGYATKWMKPKKRNSGQQVANVRYVWWNDDSVHIIFFWQDAICLEIELIYLCDMYINLHFVPIVQSIYLVLCGATCICARSMRLRLCFWSTSPYHFHASFILIWLTIMPLFNVIIHCSNQPIQRVY